MKTYITATFTYSRIKLKNSFAKVKNKTCQNTTIHTHTAFVFVSAQCVKCSKVDFMKAALER